MSGSRSTLLSKAILTFVGLSSLWISGCSSGKAPDPLPESEAAAGQEDIGERIFLDTRFAEYFAQNMTGINDPLATGDAMVAQVTTPAEFPGMSLSSEDIDALVAFLKALTEDYDDA